MPEADNEALRWTAALKGNGQAFGSLFDLHKERVYRHALRLSTTTHDAEDLTAGAFLELWRKRRAVRVVDGSVLPWLLVTTTNLSRNLARGLRRHRALIDRLPRAPSASDSAELTWDERSGSELAQRTREALARLSSGDAALIMMTAYEGFSPQQAAAALGISDGAARARLYRARQRLAQLLGQDRGATWTSAPSQQKAQQ